MESIRLGYPGEVDDAARVRAFLQDARTYWQTRWVLIGGDTEVIPIRKAYAQATVLGTRLIPTDLYYSCLDGSWNADGDDRYGEYPRLGEPGDDVDFIPDVFVGRAPVATAAEARAFVEKTCGYMLEPGDNDRTALILGDVINEVADTGPWAEDLRGRLLEQNVRVAALYQNHAEPAWMPPVYPLGRPTAIDSLAQGYRLVFALCGGGDSTRLVVGDERSGQFLTVPDALALGNTGRFSHVWAPGCINDIEAPTSFGEALIKSASGGAVSVVAMTEQTLMSIGIPMSQAFVAAMLSDTATVGEAMVHQTLELLTGPGAAPEPLAFFGVLLLGDPELPFRVPGIDPLAARPGRERTRGSVGWSMAAVEGSVSAGSDAAIELRGAQPNPASRSMRIEWAIPEAMNGQPYEVDVFDLSGRRVRRLGQGTAAAGEGSAAWDLRDEHGAALGRGLYFARLRVGGEVRTRRVMIMR